MVSVDCLSQSSASAASLTLSTISTPDTHSESWARGYETLAEMLSTVPETNDRVGADSSRGSIACRERHQFVLTSRWTIRKICRTRPVGRADDSRVDQSRLC